MRKLIITLLLALLTMSCVQKPEYIDRATHNMELRDVTDEEFIDVNKPYEMNEFDGEFVMQSIKRLDNLYEKYESSRQKGQFKAFKSLEYSYKKYITNYENSNRGYVDSLQIQLYEAIVTADNHGISIKLYDPLVGEIYNADEEYYQNQYK